MNNIHMSKKSHLAPSQCEPGGKQLFIPEGLALQQKIVEALLQVTQWSRCAVVAMTSPTSNVRDRLAKFLEVSTGIPRGLVVCSLRGEIKEESPLLRPDDVLLVPAYENRSWRVSAGKKYYRNCDKIVLVSKLSVAASGAQLSTLMELDALIAANVGSQFYVRIQDVLNGTLQQKLSPHRLNPTAGNMLGAKHRSMKKNRHGKRHLHGWRPLSKDPQGSSGSPNKTGRYLNYGEGTVDWFY